MYDGRKVERSSTSYPMLEAYYSDWHQLEFYFKEWTEGYDQDGKLRKFKDYGHFETSEDELGGIHSAVIGINLKNFPNPEKSFDEFIQMFTFTWLHEYLHLVGLSELGLRILREREFPV